MTSKFKLGLIINPIAGIGGSVALKGSDGEGIAEKALSLGAEAKANKRTATALAVLLPYKAQIEVLTVNGDMGEQRAVELGFNTQVCYTAQSPTQAQDTENAVNALLANNVDIILFAGGDGTARNVCSQVADKCPVLGVPAGCKIHSGVYAVTPKAAGRVIEMMVTHQLVTLSEADVMDIDESLFRDGIVKAKRYGEMKVPIELRYMQATKSGGKESDELVLQDIAAHVIDEVDDSLTVIGSGSTTAFVMEEQGLENTLLGVDLIQDQSVIANDLTESQLWELLEKLGKNNESPIRLVITLIGGQGHIFGRGNQQLSPRVIRKIGIDNILIIATKSKLSALESRPLIADTGDELLDKELSGFLPIITGYKDQVLYPVASPE
ncbi:ATP-NAD kinase family protein [Thalassotalea sp. M1531]|uniref:ATP-NAD kinase family protein n=1 Tax=Thalassotalea algicola TaxID=2716224 RepID=A0A7Y0LCR1_9GAMM|nr:ATP-NAD kinase family protein [Thalassotalea algicola]NMP31246.1 ATP-NAD kinase family protein [Thalassotalea algicola]